MAGLRRVLLIGALVTVAAASGACAPTRDTRGYVLNERAVGGITLGQDTRDSVLVALGTPSAVGTFHKDHWYYIGAQTEQVPYRRPDVLDQHVVAIAFNERGIVSDIQRYTLADAMAINPVDRETETRGRSFSIMEQLMGNIGRFNTQGTQRGVGAPQ